MHSCLQTSSSSFPNMASLTTFLLLSSLLFISSAQSDDYRYRNCSSTFKCGYLQESLSYPFWSESRPQYCGHPSFKLSCNDNVTIEVGSQTLTVVNVSMATKSMVLSWSGYSFDPCPQNPQNITIDQAIFNYTSNVDLVKFFYGCPSSPPYEQGEANYSCPTSSHYSGKMAYYIVNPVSDSTHESCEVNVVVPMLETPRIGSDSSSVLRCLKEGFQVDWVGLEGVGSCDDCVGSGGVCGYDWSSKNQDCFCEDGVRFGGGCNGSSSSLGNVPTSTSDGYTNPSSDHSTGKISGKTVAIGVGAGLLGALVLIGVGFIFYRRRYKKPYQTPANQVSHRKNVPLDPTALSNVENGDSFLGVSLFNYDELEEATEYFSPSKELGEGGFGTVYHGKLGDGREVAIKRMFENNSKRVQQFMNEIEILTHLRHKNLVTLYGCTSRHSRELLLVYEYVSNGTVADHLHCRKARLAPNAEYSPLSWHTRLSIAIETASALVYLHASDIIHRDVKTNNILLDDHCTVKVADFGLSRLFPLDLTHVSTAPQGTPGYVDPEYHQCYQLTDKSDVYSFGVVLIELISTQPAVDITRHRHEINLSNLAINKIQNDSLHELVDPSLGFDVDEKVKEEVIGVAELAFQCLQHDREMRPTMDEVLEVLTRIRECKKQDDMIKKSEYMGVMKAEVVDISAEEALRLKTDLSPASSNGSKRKIDTDNTSTSRSC